MKIVNVILSVFILLLAIASAVFSYFLFEKRSQFVTGWGQFAQTIHGASSELDQGSGSNYAQELTPEILAHEKYSELTTHLPKLIEQSKLVIKERDAMGEGLRRIGFSIRMKNLPEKQAIFSLDSYPANISAIEGAVGEAIELRNRVYRNLAGFAQSELAVRVRVEDIASGSNAPFASMKSAIALQREKVKAYEYGLNRVAAEVGGRTPDFRKYQTVTDESIAKIREQRAMRKKLEQQLRGLQQEKILLEGDLKASRERNAKQSETIDGLLMQIADCRRALGIPSESDEKIELWPAGSEKALSKLSGRVMEVSEEFGYVVINLGSKSVVKQPVGKKLVDVPLGIASGMELVIMRERWRDTPKFISRVTVDQVNPDTLTANIPAGSQEISKGDLVCYIKPQPEVNAGAPAKSGK